MIRNSQNNRNKKTHVALREKIIALVAKHSRSQLDLYNACGRKDLKYSVFRQLLEDMDSDGEILINKNERVLPIEPPETKTAPPAPETLPQSPAESPESTTTPPEATHTTPETLIHCLVNRSLILKHPKDKEIIKKDSDAYYAHRNFTIEQIPLENVIEETLLNGFQFVPGEFTENPDPKIGIKSGINWRSQQLFLLEFDNATENTLAEFIEARPFVKENAWLLVESLRSRYNDSEDEECNGQLRLRIVLCMPRPVTNRDEHKWIYTTLQEEFPDCDKSANTIISGGLGRLEAEHIKIGKIVDTDWFESVIRAGRQAQREAQQAEAHATAERQRRQAERAALGFTEREGELPLEALAKVDPSLFLESLGLSLKSESGQYQHWGRPEKQGDTALSIWQSAQGNYQIRVFANSVPIPPSVSGAMPFTRFYCYHELNIDIDELQPDTPQWKDINAQLASQGYGTWLSDEEFRAKHAPQTPTYSNNTRDPRSSTTLPPNHPLLTSAPPVEIRETPSFRYFSQEERAVVSGVLSLDPNAGWHGQTPVFTPKYEYLHPLTNKFALNGQPSEVEKRRVWSTLFGKCELCGAVTAEWIDRYLLTAGFYCDGCHKDFHLGSYLEQELARRLPNSIDSDYQGFLGDDPAFADFRLWQPSMLTHLGAGMATGKSTETYKQMTALAIQGLGKGIIAVPRVSLARFLAHYLRQQHGHRTWGLWHEGCRKSDKFIGDFGAIVCLPSLPNAVRSATDAGVSRLYLAIDELDFAYGLLSVSVEQATAVKKCLRDALTSTGLVVSGQTESTLALEAFAQELEAEEVQGFYNTAEPANGNVVMHKYPNTEGKSNDILSGTIDNISDLLTAGHNVYAFCSSRRDGDLIADEFQSENPVVYNAYTKGEARADAVLKNQRLTDSRLFIATSAAGVGISILDPKARTIIATGLLYGTRKASMSVQECVRDRGRCGVDYHYTDYDLPLPIRPTENEEVSIYHEALKVAASRKAEISSAGIRKTAYAQALASLADTQIETFIEHHLGTVGNMSVNPASAIISAPPQIASRRSELQNEERQKKITTATGFLQQREILTTSQIRLQSNAGTLTTDLQLAHETANAVAQAVGWNEKKNDLKDVLTDEGLNIAIGLVQANINIKKLTQQREGYLAVQFPRWTAHRLQSDLEESDAQLTFDGLGIESTTIKDNRFRGELLTALLDRLTGKVFATVSLAEAVREVLKSNCTMGTTFGSEIRLGALGASAYRKARFLHVADDDWVVDWVSHFIKEWYPARISKNGDTFALCHAKHAQLRLTAIAQWLMHQPSVPDGIKIDLDIFEPTQLHNPNAERKAEARHRRTQGETLSEIADVLDISLSTASEWCKGITPEKKTDDPRSVREIVKQDGIPKSTAYWRTQKQRNVDRAKTLKQVLKLAEQGKSVRKIATQLGISRGKVEGILKNSKVS